MCHSLFIYSPTDEHLGGFQVLAVINKAAIIVLCRFLCQKKFSAPLGKKQGA